MMTTKLDKATTPEAAHSALAVSLSSAGHTSCPDLKAIYLFILKAFCVTSVLGWLFIACPAAVADAAYTTGLTANVVTQSHAANVSEFGRIPGKAIQHDAVWQQYAAGYRSADGLHSGVLRLRQLLSAWWASKADQSAITTQVKNLIAASGDGPYAAWSYKLDASSKALQLNVRYEF